MMSKIMSDQIASTVSDAVDSTAAVVPVQATLSVIIPAFNEVGTVAEILRRVLQQSVVSEIVFVDDGSTDGTWDAVQELIEALPADDLQRLVVWQHAANRGKGRAIRTGLEHVTGTHVLIQDADLEYDPADIAKLWKVMQSGDADVVYGSRYLENPNLQQGRFVLQSGVRFLNLLTRLLYGIRLTDQATCYKLFRTTDLRSFNLNCERFEFCAEVTAKAARRKFRITELPICYLARGTDDGKKLRLSDGLTAVGQLVQLRFTADSTAAPPSLSDVSAGGRGLIRRVCSSVAPALIVVLLALFFAVTRFGSLPAAVAWVQGKVVHVQEHDVGNVQAGIPVTVMLPVTNLQGHSVTIVGAETDCGCAVAAGLPLKINSLDTGQFSVVVTPRSADQGQPFTRSVSLLLNVNSAPILIRVRGSVGG